MTNLIGCHQGANTQPRPFIDITRPVHLLNISIIIYEFLSNRPIRSFSLPWHIPGGHVEDLLYSSAIKQLLYDSYIPSGINEQ